MSYPVDLDARCERLTALARRNDSAAWGIARRTVGLAFGFEFGREGFLCCDDGHSVDYVNRGDPYDETIVRVDNGPFIVSCWGGEFEQLEQEYCEANDLARCGYCGEFSDRESFDERDSSRCADCGGVSEQLRLEREAEEADELADYAEQNTLDDYPTGSEWWTQ